MQVTYSDKARQEGEDFKLLQQASNRLEEILGKAAPRVGAEWDRRDEPMGRHRYTLRITDNSFSSSMEFDRNELQIPDEYQFRLYDLWDNILKAHIEKHLHDLRDDED